MGLNDVVDLMWGFPPGAQGETGPKNTIAPAIETDAVIGTEIVGDDGTWTPVPDSYTYQWQRYTGGAWANISLATNKNYTPVDADFGLALRLAVTATSGDSTTAYSNSTSLVVEVPEQSLGEEVLQNGDMSSATGWSVGTSWSIAGGVATSTDNTFSSLVQAALTEGDYYETGAQVTRTSGSLVHKLGGITVRIVNADLTFLDVGRAGADGWLVYGISAYNGTVDNATAKKITLNGQLVAPLADGVVEFYFELPGTPIAGQVVIGLLRILDFAAGNFWRVLLKRNDSNTAWNIYLQSLDAFTATNQITKTNVGDINAWRVTMAGDDWALETSSDGGDTWVPRGSVNNSLYATATGINALYSSDVLPGVLTYGPL